MKDWPWQKWVGKIILFAIAAIMALINTFPAVDIPLWAILIPIATQLAQWLIGWLPGTKWNVVLGKALLMIIASVEILLGALGVDMSFWAALAPLIGGLAQLLIGLSAET